MVAGKSGKYHLYKRTINVSASGKPVKAWYYWFDDDSGARLRRACGTAKVPCLKQKDAEAAIARIEAAEEEALQAADEALRVSHAVRIRDVAADMYTEDSKHMRLRKERGEGLTDTTMKECRGYLKNYILPKWGDHLPGDMDGAEIEDWLLDIDRSNAWRNRCLEVFGEVFSECVRYKIIARAPEIKRFKRRGLKRDVLSTAEIEALFPECPGALECIWRHPDPREPASCGLMFAALFSLVIGTGLRSGEGNLSR